MEPDEVVCPETVVSDEVVWPETVEPDEGVGPVPVEPDEVVWPVAVDPDEVVGLVAVIPADVVCPDRVDEMVEDELEVVVVHNAKNILLTSLKTTCGDNYQIRRILLLDLPVEQLQKSQFALFAPATPW